MELKQIASRTYYIENPTNIGIYLVNDHDVYLIDSGNDKDAGKKILKIIEEKGWNILGVILTHSHADHIGGAQVLQNRTGCKVFASEIDQCFTTYPILEPSLLWGGAPFHALQNKFLCAKESIVSSLEDFEGLSIFSLSGHSPSMIGIRSLDGVCFLGDALFSEETVSKYHLFYIYDVCKFLHTLDFLENLEGNCFVLAHGVVTSDIHDLISLNRKKVLEICECISSYLSVSHTFEEILQFLFEHYDLTMNLNQYVLIGSTLRSYLTYLCDEGGITYSFENNCMKWMRSL